MKMDLESSKKPRLGIMGGTFDPIHYGHLLAAERAKQAFSLEKVLFVPTGNPPHKTGIPISVANWRLEMVELAIEDNPAFASSALELQREGLSYTFDTLAMLRQLYPEYELYFITGADAFRDIFTWYKAAELFELASFIGVTRLGFEVDGFLELVEAAHPEIRGKFFLLEIPALAISSSDIRIRVSQAQSVRYLLPESVRLFIKNRQLYAPTIQGDI